VRFQPQRNLSSSKNLTKICSDLRMLEGGSVDLTTDQSTGIAVITINNTDKRNALSGLFMLKMIYLHFIVKITYTFL